MHMEIFYLSSTTLILSNKQVAVDKDLKREIEVCPVKFKIL